MVDQIASFLILVCCLAAFIYFVKYAYREFHLKKGILCERCNRPSMLHGETYNQNHPICPLSMERVILDWQEREIKKHDDANRSNPYNAGSQPR
jgi:hypothetical protein